MYQQQKQQCNATNGAAVQSRVGGAIIQATELAFPQFQEEDAHLNTSIYDKALTSRSTWQVSTIVL
jgi:hypothetical protein